jgi:hypothetical protein
MDVPDIRLVEVSEETPAEVMEEPGAQREIQEPQLEKLDLLSSLVVEPTQKARDAAQGEARQPSMLRLPAATIITTPAESAALTALLCVELNPP